jgi:hypothetical protein
MLTNQRDGLKSMSQIYKTGLHTCRMTLNWANGKTKHFQGPFGVEAAMQRLKDAENAAGHPARTEGQ